MSIVNKAILQSFGEALFSKIKARFVDKSGENIISGKTTILNGYIPGGIIHHFNNTNTMHIANGTGHYCGTRNKSIPANRHISHIVFAVRDDYEIGKVIDGVNIGIVKTDNNEVLEMLKINAKYPVQKNESSNITGDRVVVVDIDKTYQEEVYVIFGARGLIWNDTVGHGYLQCAGGDSIPQVGTILRPSTGNFIGKFEIYGSGIALRDLGGSGTGGVSRGEFDQHVAANEQQHQTFTSDISTNTQSINTANQNITNLSSRVDNIHTNVTSQGERIVNLESNVVKSNTQNTFTSKNVFMENSPIVNKYFSIKNIVENNATDVPYDKSTYCCNPKQGIGANVHISAILVPIHDSRPGDRIEAAYFVVNADNQRVVGDVPNLSTYTVQDIQYKGHYCIAFEVNRTFSHSVGFGFSVRDTLFEGRRIRLLKQNANSNAWTSHLRPSNNEVLNHNDTFLIPYAITRRASSEVVTRFDLANNTVPTGNYRVGELKMLVYDAGESIEIGGHTWLRCDGQTVSSGDYSELYDTIGFQFNTSSEYTIRPLNDDGTDVSVDFNLPTNQNVGYLYICAKQKGHSMSGL